MASAPTGNGAGPVAWSVLALAVLLWPANVPGMFDGAPLDGGPEAVVVGLLLPVLCWFHGGFLRGDNRGARVTGGHDRLPGCRQIVEQSAIPLAGFLLFRRDAGSHMCGSERVDTIASAACIEARRRPQQALEARNLSHVVIWVRAGDEAEIRAGRTSSSFTMSSGSARRS